ncbi:hypothetical protein ACFQV2_38435 [Actinokineospora soli]|uniref:Uncharacterized protein n=1 Tax=Actinokineospora soli TaxID=1048753 RepID=A0ABW2TWV1_9PSEU
MPRIKAAIDDVPLIGSVLNTIISGVQNALTSGCGIVVDAVNAVAAPVQDGGEAVGGAIEEGVARVLPGGTAPGGGTPGGGTPGGGTPGGGTPGGGTPGGGTGGGGGAPTLPGVTNPIVGGGSGLGGLPLYDGLGRVPRDYYGDIPAFAPGLFSPSPALRYGGAVPGYTPSSASSASPAATASRPRATPRRSARRAATRSRCRCCWPCWSCPA